MAEPTPAQIEAGAKAARLCCAWHAAETVLAAVLPMARAAVIEEIVADFDARCSCPQWADGVCAHEIAVAVVRSHATPSQEASHG